ncbi:MAG: hypothetical protein HY280_00150 [Nitrospinae bacterium]|nr:hypothetical protein [Nitrospinota bacterium]
MVTVKKATLDDFEDVYRFLSSIKGAAVEKERMRRIFSNVWRTDEGYCGNILLDENKVVGFFGMLFSRREIGGAVLKVCNLNTWFVDERYRGDSLKLVTPILKLKDYLMTDMTASKKVSFIFEKLGFKALESAWALMPPVPTFSTLTAVLRYKYSFGAEKAAEILRGAELKILEDHRDFGCGHLVISDKENHCHVIFNRSWKKKRIPLVSVYYVSNPELFLKALGYVRLVLPIVAGAIGTVVDKRLLKGHSGPLIFYKAMPTPPNRQYKSPVELEPELVDNLYSELVLLGY